MGDPVYHGAAAGDAQVLCVVVHGRGQTQEDMMASIVRRLDVPGVRFVLPKSDGAGWYAARAIDPLTDQTRAEMTAGIDQITALIANAQRGARDCPVMYCGFSQGACLGVEVLMRHPDLVDAACLLTACRIGGPDDDLPLPPLNALPVYASCGDDDPWIPAAAHHAMLHALTQAGARVRADMFPGRPHEITDTEIAAMAEMLRALIADRAVLEGAA